MSVKKRKKFAAVEDHYLRTHYLELTCREMAQALERTKSSVSNRMHKLGLLRPSEVRNVMSVKAQFHPGRVSWNKGRVGIHLSPGTEFKKGHLPHNTKHDGCIVIRTHKRTGISSKYIRVALGKWKLLHRHIWEQTHGAIPEAHIVGFKDGDTLNCALENLYLMSCADNARRNHNPVKASVGLRAAWERMQHLESDHYVASTLAQRDLSLREDILRHPDLIEMKRAQLKLRRVLRDVSTANTGK